MASPLVELLETLTAEQADELYNSPWACRAVLQALPALAKQYVLRLAHVQQCVSEHMLAQWAADGAETAHATAISRMLSLRVLVQNTGSNDSNSYDGLKLHNKFQNQLITMLHSFIDASDAVPSHLLERVPSADELLEHARICWDRVLLHLLPSKQKHAAVLSNTTTSGQSRSTGGWLEPVALFQLAGLLSNTGGVTTDGFQFLMRSTAAQLWRLMREYVQEAQRSGSTGVAVVAFALRLGFQQQGQVYCLHQKESLETQAAADFARMGLVYVVYEDDTCMWYVPTQLASTLLATETAEESRSSPQGSVLVETNMRIYAYTQSPVQLSILRMLSNEDALLPNLYIGTITRAKIRSALVSVTAEQIVSFLTLHAHTQVATKRWPLPERIADQIYLWEQEMRRMDFTQAALYTEFKTYEMFQRVVQQVRAMNALLWCSHMSSEQDGSQQNEGMHDGNDANTLSHRGTLKLVCPLGIKEEIDVIIKNERKREKKRERGEV